jgi:hypothetical protein
MLAFATKLADGIMKLALKYFIASQEKKKLSDCSFR